VLIILAIFILHKLSTQSQWNDTKSLKLLNDSLSSLWANLDRKITDSSKSIDEKLGRTSEILDRKLADSHKMMWENMSKTFDTSSRINTQANKAIEEITKKLTKLEETNAQIKDIWGQLQWLENILKNPKQRGNLWEYFLKELLENVFSEWQYKIQYIIEWVGVVDAALFIGKKIIPIDAKFPQENYERLIKSEDEYSINKYWSELKKDIKKRIDETSKYIKPENNTTDFSFMLIPAEWMYYDIFIAKVWGISAKEIIEYAFKKKVIICSPSSFYAYLQTVMQWMKALQIENEAKEIQKYVVKLQKDLEKYEEIFSKVWASLWTTVNHYNAANKRLEIIDTDIFKLTSGQAGGKSQFEEIKKPE
jgi:DNA recombination protein RmuC